VGSGGGERVYRRNAVVAVLADGSSGAFSGV
jgi:hypothetical protein